MLAGLLCKGSLNGLGELAVLGQLPDVFRVGNVLARHKNGRHDAVVRDVHERLLHLESLQLVVHLVEFDNVGLGVRLLDGRNNVGKVLRPGQTHHKDLVLSDELACLVVVFDDGLDVGCVSHGECVCVRVFVGGGVCLCS